MSVRDRLAEHRSSVGLTVERCAAVLHPQSFHAQPYDVALVCTLLASTQELPDHAKITMARVVSL